MHLIVKDNLKHLDDKSGKNYFQLRRHSYLSRDFNSDFIKNLIHNILAFFFIIRAIKDVIQCVIDLGGWGGKKQLLSKRFQAVFTFLEGSPNIYYTILLYYSKLRKQTNYKSHFQMLK